MSLIIFIAILIALIWVHELGHFTAAKLLGIRVDEFAIGFPPRLLRVKYGETEYTFNLLLVGGFVRIHGEDPGTSAHDKRSMAGKHRALQALVICAGIIMNLLFGWLVLSAGYMVGMPSSTEEESFAVPQNVAVTVVYILPGAPADRAGFAQGDTIERITTGTAQFTPTPGDQGKATQDFISAHQNESLIFSLNHKGTEKTLLVKAEEGIVDGKKAIGIQMADVGILKLPVHLALAQGALSAKDLTVSTANGLIGFFGELFQGHAKWSDVSGPVGIAGAGGAAVREGFSAAAFLTALISINLALINIIPIPGLDGGRLLIIIIEGILRRPVSAQIVSRLSFAGFALIITLMILVTYHDIVRLLG